MQYFKFIPTKIGSIVIVWSETGLERLYLPEKNKQSMQVKISHDFPKAKEVKNVGKEFSLWLEKLEVAIIKYAEGEEILFPEIPLVEKDVPEFHRKIWKMAQKIPRGKVFTYGDLAKKVGSPGAARAVGQAMAKNRFPLLIPCHRVVGSGQKLCGFSAFRGVDLKSDLLAMEGYSIRGA